MSAVQRVLRIRTERGAWYVGGSACATICHGLNLFDAALLEKTGGFLIHYLSETRQANSRNKLDVSSRLVCHACWGWGALCRSRGLAQLRNSILIWSVLLKATERT